ncbi:MAG: hypothetical protein M0Q53_20600 [Prolixibacteraceae bacterium]|jgi:hypothetical protein|nr:hypothetical protein [Prolixibacteraceae bacterium]
MLKLIGICLLVIAIVGFSPIEEKDSLQIDAVAIWNMGDAKNKTGKGGLITTIGDVKLGVKLNNGELKTTPKQFSDGNVAVFEGGYLVVGNKQIQLTGKDMTLSMRFLNQSNGNDIPLLAKNNANDEFGKILYQKDGMLEYLWQTSPANDRVSPDWFKKKKNLPIDFLNGTLRIGTPIGMIGTNRWQTVVIRFRETVIEMYIDGVLVDEEWTHGSLYNFNGPFLIGAGYEKGKIKTGFNGMIDYVALWDRALANDEITYVSGGQNFVSKRDIEILGHEQSSLQYWHPRGYNTSAGDVMCLFNEGTFHVFWLYDRRHHGSKWIMGAHQYAHVSTRNLIDWEHHPIAIPITRPWESAMGTGDFIVNNGVYHAFYTDCGGRVEFPEKPHKGSGIFQATSTDGIHYIKGEKPVIEGGDCSIFFDDVTAQFYLLTGGRDGNGQRVVVYYTSTDMKNWSKQKDPLLDSGGNCPHLFKWNSWYYLSVNHRFLRSQTIYGPWIQNEPSRISRLQYPKTAGFTGGRRIAGGWIGNEGFGGDLAFFELVQNPDGSLGTKFVPEMIPASGDPLDLNFITGHSYLTIHPHGPGIDSLKQAFTLPHKKVKGKSECVRIDGQDGFKAVMLDEIPQNVRITMTVKPTADSKLFGLCMRGDGDYARGIELQFDISGKRVQFGEPQNGLPAPESKIALNNVDGLDKPFTLDIIVTGTIIDVNIDNRQTLITRCYEDGNRLFLYAKNGDVTFKDIKVRPLVRIR